MVPTMSEELVVSTVDGVRTLTINRPERRNALSWDVIRGLREQAQAARTDDDVRCLVITGAGDRAFCAGADLGGMADNASYAEVHDARGELAQAIEQAIVDAGMQPVNLGAIPTPALCAYAMGRGLGSMMVTGSHIPFHRNGYKTNSAVGELLSADVQYVQLGTGQPWLEMACRTRSGKDGIL